MNEAGGGEPKQNFETVQPPEADEVSKGKSIEKQRPASQESAAGKQTAPAAIQPLPAIPGLPAAVPVALPTDDIAAPVSPPVTTKLPAADGDRIEKQWIDKAKAIVAQTKDDPYKQKHEVSKIKADYIAKRYNKIVKTEPA